ncbi:transmembrane protease serine 9-like [Anopheles albimanus]|uniref:transmembrane protease serine 9-like n=1 Tax=Anopheles albimanus TaxID=7167 RepID=UPI00163E68D3|nr:transmembrane protease serine 9-like [Anopheles albimanus]
MKIHLWIIVAVLGAAPTHQKASPCPAVLTYDEQDDSSSTWFGTMRLKSNVPLHGVFVDVLFTSEVLEFGTFLKGFSTENNIEFHMTDKTKNMRAGEVYVLKIFVRYQSDKQVPLVRHIRFNGQSICTDTKPAARTNPTARRPFTTGPTRQRTTTGWNQPNRRLTSSELEQDNPDEFPHVVQPVNAYATLSPPVEPSVYHSDSPSLHDTVSTRAINEKAVEPLSPALYPIRVAVADGAEDHTPPVDSVEPAELDTGLPIRRYSTTTRSPIPREQIWDTTLRPLTTNPRPHQSNIQYDRLAGIALNAGDDTVISNRPSTPRPVPRTTTIKPQYFAGDYAFLRKDDAGTNGPKHYINNHQQDICGTVVPKANPLVTHGSVSERGQFPWHGALYRSSLTELRYLCGATLVSARMTITAAHCVTLEKSNKPVDAKSMLLFFGKIELSKWNGVEEDAQIQTVHLPAQYNHERFFSDIAVLTLKEDVKFSNFIRPVCLWSFDDDYKTLVNKIGFVPGWGYTEHGLVSSRLSFAQMPVVAHETCIWSNRDFFSRVTSDSSFCAGFKNGTSVCNGDSGGGMVFKHNGRWYLRGVVSVSAALQDRFRCDPNHYVVFTDVAKFNKWIQNLTVTKD